MNIPYFRTPKRIASQLSLRSATMLAAFIVLPAVGYFTYVSMFGVNVPFWDDWSMVPMFVAILSGHFSLSALWIQHNENRMLIPNIVTIAVGMLTHYNTKVLMFLSAMILTAVVALLAAVWVRTRLSLWLFAPISIVLFGIIQNENTLWGFQLAWYLVILCVIVSIMSLTNNGLKWYVVAVLTAVGASFCSLQGLIIWPVGILYLGREFLSGRGSGRSLLLWAASALLSVVFYFIDFNFGETGAPPASFILAHPLAVAQYFMATFGSVAPVGGIYFTELFGGIIFFLALYTIIDYLRRRPNRTGSIFAMLVMFGALFDVALTLGRSSFGVLEATSSRYSTYNLALLVGLYGYLVSRQDASDQSEQERLHRMHRIRLGLPLATLILLLAFQVTVSTIDGLMQGRSTYLSRLSAADALINYNKAPRSLVTTAIYPSFQYFHSEAPLVAHFRLSIWASSSQTTRLRALGIVSSQEIARDYSRGSGS